MRGLPALAAIALASLTALPSAEAQSTYPSRQVRFIVPQSPGTASDYLARLLGQHLSSRLGHPFIVENMAGAGGTIGSTAAAAAPADGHTIALIGPAHVSNALLRQSPPYRPIEDFSPVAQIASMPNVIVVSGQSGVRTVADLIQLSKEKSGELNFGSVGIGSSSHLAVELFVHTVGIKATHVTYRTQANLIADLIGGRIQFYSAPLAAVMALLQNKRATALAVGSRNRADLLPDTPTMRELGHPGYTSEAWFGIAGPAGLSPEIVQVLNSWLSALLDDPAIRASLLSQGATPLYAGPKAFTDVQLAEFDQTRRILQLINFKPE